MNRRLVLKMLGATSLGDFAVAAATPAGDEILELDCAGLLAAIRDGSVRAEQVCAKFLEQYERQRFLNVATWLDPSKFLSQARDVDRVRDRGVRLPALAGLPILVKDNIDTLGFPTSAGTAFLQQNFPRSNAPAVERLVQHGAIVMGKANMHELALGVTSTNPVFGPVRNPYNPELIPGGSSGGSAAAIAARIVPAALGTDTTGSVRIPAALCGTVGFRPTVYPRKVYSQQGVVPLLLDLDTIGPMGRCVADVALLHATITGQSLVQPRSLGTARIGVPKSAYWEDLDPKVERVAQAALARLSDQGAVLVEVDLRDVIDAAWQLFYALVSRADPQEFLRIGVPSLSLRDLAPRIASRDVRAAVERVEKNRSDPNSRNARGVTREGVNAAYRAVFRQHGIQAVVFPTVVLPPPPIRATGDDADETIQFNGRPVPQALTLARNTLPAAALGVPGVSLPAGLTSNALPVGLEFDGLPGSDDALLALCGAAEVAIGRVPAP